MHFIRKLIYQLQLIIYYSIEYIFMSITWYRSNSVIVFLLKFRLRETFSSSQEKSSQRHIEEQDLGGWDTWENKKRRGTNTDTEISYTNKQKEDLGCCSLQT